MAEKAQAEPTMEEILASIRKIIADDSDARSSPAAKAAAAEKPSVEMKDSDDFDDLSLDDVLETSTADLDDLGDDSIEDFESIGSDVSGDELLSDVDEEMFEELTTRTEVESPAESEAEPSFEQELEDFGLDSLSLDDEAPVIEDPDPEEDWTVGGDIDLIDEEPATTPALEQELHEQHAAASAPAPAHAPEPADAGLTDDRIAGAAASALGKLMVKQNEEGGSATTIEGLMRELLRPMLKEWLDANLPDIVERKVEEEVQRIARMAR